MLDSLITFLLIPFQAILDLILSGFQFISDFITTDIYPLITATIAEMIKSSLIASIQFKIATLKFSWDIARDLLLTLNISPMITAAWGTVDGKLLQFLTFFRIPEGINLLVSAWSTRFVYRFIGF